MTFTFKRRSIASEPNAREVESLCAWIQENSNQPLGWSQLTKQSGFTKEQLVELFHIYKQTTPMAFVRMVRLQKKQGKEDQVPLFNDIRMDTNESDFFT